MRIAILNETFLPEGIGGIKRWYWELTRRFAKWGHQVHVYSLHWEGMPKIEMIEGIKIFRLSKIKDLYVGRGRRPFYSELNYAIKVFKHLLRKEEYDIIDCGPYIPAFSGSFVSMIKKIPVIFFLPDVIGLNWSTYLESRIWGMVGLLTERLTAKLHYNHIITITKLVKERLVNILKIPEEKIDVISCGVDIQTFDNIEVKKEKHSILYAGWLVPHKHVDWLIKAMPSVLKKVPDAHLDIIGDGPLRNELLAFVKRLKLSDNITFHGYLQNYKDVAYFMRKAEVFVNPSTREGQSHVLLEAMAARTPPIGIYKPDSGVTETIKHGINGLLTHPDELSDSIVKIFQDKDFSKMLAENGRKFAEERDWNKISEMVLNVYDSVARK